MPARPTRMIRQPSLDPDEPGSVLVDGGVTSGVPVSPPTPPVSDVDVATEVVSDTSEVSVVWVDWVDSDTSEVSVVWVDWVDSETSEVSVVWEDSVVWVDWVDWVDSDTSDVSVVLVDWVDDVHVDVVDDVWLQPQSGPSWAATAVPGMSSAAPSSRTAPIQPKRRMTTVREWFLSVMSLCPRVGWMNAFP